MLIFRGGSRAPPCKYSSVKFLFDENLSPRLPKLLADDFVECEHLRNVGLMGATDAELWTCDSLHRFYCFEVKD